MQQILALFLLNQTFLWRLNMLKHTLKVPTPLTTILQVGRTKFRYVMKKLYFLMVLASMSVFLTGCPKTVPIPETSFDDLDKVRALTAEEEAANAKVLSDYGKKEEIIEEIKGTDIAEKKELVKEKEVVEEAKKEFKVLAEKVVEKRRKKLLEKEVEKIAESIKEGVTEEEIVEILEKVATREITKPEARALLKEKTTLTEKKIEKLLAKTETIQKETEILVKKLEDASPEEVAEILKEAGGVSKIDILKLVEKKKVVDTIETTFLEKTMAKLYTRLVRDKELGVAEAFCINIEGILDHLLVPPSYFETNKHNLDDYLDQINSSFRLIEPILAEYEDIVVQLEGNADERGTVDYNKALSDRRWATPSKVLLALYFEEDQTQGVGRSEQCPLPRAAGVSNEAYWSTNRRTDYIFKLK